MAERLALLDLGSNAARFVLVSIDPGVGFRLLREARVQSRLGGGRRGLLPAAAVQETLAAAHRFLRDVRRRPGVRVLAVATAAVREASNAERLLGALRRDEDVAVEVLSGEEEARLGAAAAIASLRLADGLVADLGGGSLQLSRVRDGEVAYVTSLPLGAVRLTQRFLEDDPPTPMELGALHREVQKHLHVLADPAAGDEPLVGLGGTVRTLGRIHLGGDTPSRRSRRGLRLRRADVVAIRERLESLPLRRRRRIRGLKAERADIIVAGAIVVDELMRLGGFDALTVCEQGVRHGVLLRETFTGEVPA